MTTKYEQRFDKQWVDVTDGELVACCDCGLVHYLDYSILDGRILRRAIRDNRQTVNRRRRTDVKQAIKKLSRR